MHLSGLGPGRGALVPGPSIAAWRRQAVRRRPAVSHPAPPELTDFACLPHSPAGHRRGDSAGARGGCFRRAAHCPRGAWGTGRVSGAGARRPAHDARGRCRHGACVARPGGSQPRKRRRWLAPWPARAQPGKLTAVSRPWAPQTRPFLPPPPVALPPGRHAMPPRRI